MKKGLCTVFFVLAIMVLLAFMSTFNCMAQGKSSCTVVKDKVLCQNAVFPCWIPWKVDKLPNAQLVYSTTDTWEIYVMDENGGNQNCLTSPTLSVLPVKFPLDIDNKPPAVHWKGAPLAHPSKPYILFTAENENSQHMKLRNTPSMGWDNDVWALNLATNTYTRLTTLPARKGLQHIAMSEDGEWYVYPYRYQFGKPLKDFGLAKMVFTRIIFNTTNGTIALKEEFIEMPNGEMYYEPHDIIKTGNNSYALLYSAGAGNVLTLYRFDWTFAGGRLQSKNNRMISAKPVEHIEFTMFSPSGKKIAWMGGPLSKTAYRADLYVSTPELLQAERVTYYNECSTWPRACKRQGAQLSPMEWHPNGRAIFFGLWIHKGPLRPAQFAELHRVDLSGDCSSD